MVFYRKYRSQTIDELDNAYIRETLYSVLQKDVPHAFLFTGPKGLGKTSTARIIAKVVNCEKAGSGLGVARSKKTTSHEQSAISKIEPCNQCEQCVSITNGTNMDVLEIDAASNRGIDEIRDLKEKIRLAPLSAKKKVYIIDEVHMLTTEAFNALLKTLEEPPDHAMFILCTTEQHKVPATIVSRCFHINFKPATQVELIRSFQRIVDGEKIAISEEALSFIANLSDRGFRDGAKLLEEVTTLANGEKITKELIEARYNVSNIATYREEMIRALGKKEMKQALVLVATVIDEGIDIKYFMEGLIEDMHGYFLSIVGVNEKDKQPVIDFTLPEIEQLFSLLAKAYGEMKYAVLPQLPLELAIIAYCSLISANPQQAASSSVSKNEVSVSSMRKQLGTIAKIKALYGDSPVKKTSGAESIVLTKVELMQASVNGNITPEWQEALWKHIISEMKSYNHTSAGVLRSCSLKSYDAKELVIETPYKFHKERLDDMKTREQLLQVCKLLTGKDIVVHVELRK